VNKIRLVFAALGLSFVALLVLASPARADNCDIFINPEDCQNTGWTIGVIATLAGGVAVGMAATTAGSNRADTQKRERERRSTAEHVDIRPTSDPPSITIQPRDGAVRGHSVTLEAHSDPGWQTVHEVDRGHDEGR
jgi:hypothetical protein